MEELPVVEFAFPGPLRDSLLEAIAAGTKTATSSLLIEYELAAEQLPAIGDRGVAVDSNGLPCLIVQTVAVQVVRLADVPLDHALAEGEGYRSVDEWRAGHSRYWRSPQMRDELGVHFDLNDETLVVLERFRVVG